MLFQGLYLIIVCTSALLGNICIWIIICKSKELRTITNVFILVLTTADLLVAAANMPVTIITIFSGEWILSEQSCSIFGYSNMITLVLSVMSLCNISINRYLMVCKSIYFKTVYTKRNAILIISGCVIVSLGLSSPPLFGWAEYSYIEEQSFCFCNWRKAPSYAFFMIGCCFGIPFTVMTICNMLIFRTVRASKRRVAAINKATNGKSPQIIAPSLTSTISSTQNDQATLYESNQSKLNRKLTIANLSTIDDVNVEVSSTNLTNDKLKVSKSKSERRIIRNLNEKHRSDEIRLALALAIVVIMFVVCWLPFCISMLIGIFSPHAVDNSFHMWTLMIGYSNSCMNPVIYGAMNKKFGEGFKDIFCRLCNR